MEHLGCVNSKQACEARDDGRRDWRRGMRFVRRFPLARFFMEQHSVDVLSFGKVSYLHIFLFFAGLMKRCEFL